MIETRYTFTSDRYHNEEVSDRIGRACDHLWERAAAGDEKSREAIVCAAQNQMLDFPDDIALCAACAAQPTSIPITYRHILVFWLDGNHLTMARAWDGPGYDKEMIVDERPA